MYFNASWILRLPPLPVTLPNEALVGLELAPPQLGWLVTLNNSVRNCTRCFSVTGKFLRMPRSHSQKPGFRRMLRGWTPNLPAAGWAKAALLNQVASLVKGVGSRLGSPTRFQN